MTATGRSRRVTAAAGDVAVIGGYGGVGSAAVRQLHAWGVDDFRIGGRSAEAAAGVVRELLGGRGHPAAVDVENAEELDGFCEGAQLVLDCAGPAARVGDRVVRAAVRAGADYASPAGDDDLVWRAAATGAGRGRVAVFGAGLLPGLTGILPRHAADVAGGAVGGRLATYAGGLDRFTSAAAADYAIASAGGFGQMFAMWRGGRRVVAPFATDLVVLPGADRPVSVQPFLTTEIERVAATLGVAEASSYTVFDGDRIRAVLADRDRTGLVDRLRRAAELDLLGRLPYQVVVARLDGLAGGAAVEVVLRGSGASELTGAALALAALAVLRGELPAGLHHADAVLDPGVAVDRLRTATAITRLTVGPVQGSDPAELSEEGVL